MKRGFNEFQTAPARFNPMDYYNTEQRTRATRMANERQFFYAVQEGTTFRAIDIKETLPAARNDAVFNCIKLIPLRAYTLNPALITGFHSDHIHEKLDWKSDLNFLALVSYDGYLTTAITPTSPNSFSMDIAILLAPGYTRLTKEFEKMTGSATLKAQLSNFYSTAQKRQKHADARAYKKPRTDSYHPSAHDTVRQHVTQTNGYTPSFGGGPAAPITRPVPATNGSQPTLREYGNSLANASPFVLQQPMPAAAGNGVGPAQAKPANPVHNTKSDSELHRETLARAMAEKLKKAETYQFRLMAAGIAVAIIIGVLLAILLCQRTLPVTQVAGGLATTGKIGFVVENSDVFAFISRTIMQILSWYDIEIAVGGAIGMAMHSASITDARVVSMFCLFGGLYIGSFVRLYL